MILSRHTLELILASGELEFSGAVRKDSLLLSLGKYAQFIAGSHNIIDPYDRRSLDGLYGEATDSWEQLILDAGGFLLISSAEYLRLDQRHFALMSTLSHVARLGLTSQPSSFYIDRGFSGHITFEISNLTSHAFILHRNMPFAKLVVFETAPGEWDPQDVLEKEEFYYGSSDNLRSRFWQEFGRAE